MKFLKNPCEVILFPLKYRNKLIPALLSRGKAKTQTQQQTTNNKNSRSMTENCFGPCTSVAMHFGSLTALDAVCGVTVFVALKTELRILPSLFGTLVNYINQVIEPVLHKQLG